MKVHHKFKQQLKLGMESLTLTNSFFIIKDALGLQFENTLYL